MQYLLIALIALATAGVPAGDAGAQSKEPEARDALDGLDPVLLVAGKEVPGKSALSVTRGDFIYLFSTADNKTAFERDPAKYEIQLSGMCAKMGKTAGGNPSDFLVHDGKIYIFGSDDCHKKFQAEPAKYLATPAPPLPSSPDAAARGRTLIERAVAAIGGAARVDGVTSYVESASQVQHRPQGDATIAIKTMRSFPDRVRQERTLALQGKTMASATILSPQGAWFVGGQGAAYPIRPFGRVSLEQDFGRHPLALLRARRSPGFKAVAAGTAIADGVSVETVRIVNSGIDVTLAIESSGRIHGTTFRDRNGDGEYGTFAIVYSDFRNAGGLQLPFSARATFNGQPDASQSVTIDAITVNTPLEAALFAPKPEGDR